MKHKEIQRCKIRELIEKNKGVPFKITFIKKDGSIRNMNAEFGVEKDLKGGVSPLEAHKEYIIVYDLDKEGYRAVNINTTKKLVINDTLYIVKDGHDKETDDCNS